jgi:hypothetical protein
MDKEAAFLAKISAVEASARSNGAGGEAAAAWGRTSVRARAALRSVWRRSPERLRDLEATLLEFAEAFAGVPDLGVPILSPGGNEGGGEDGSGEVMGSVLGEGGAPELVLPLTNTFARLLAHGLCEFHGLPSTSRLAPCGGVKELAVRTPAVRASAKTKPAEAAGVGSVAEGRRSEAAEVDTDVAGRELEEGGSVGSQRDVSRDESAQDDEVVVRWRSPKTTCTQFLEQLATL